MSQSLIWIQFTGQAIRVCYTPLVSDSDWNGGRHFHRHVTNNPHSTGGSGNIEALLRWLCMHWDPEVFAGQSTAAEKKDGLGKDSKEHSLVMENK